MLFLKSKRYVTPEMCPRWLHSAMSHAGLIPTTARPSCRNSLHFVTVVFPFGGEGEIIHMALPLATLITTHHDKMLIFGKIIKSFMRYY